MKNTSEKKMDYQKPEKRLYNSHKKQRGISFFLFSFYPVKFLIQFCTKNAFCPLFNNFKGTFLYTWRKVHGKAFNQQEKSSVVASKRTNEILYISQIAACGWTQGLLCLILQSWEGAVEGLKHIRMHSTPQMTSEPQRYLPVLPSDGQELHQHPRTRER